MRRGFVERSVGNLLRVSEQALFAEQAARRQGLLQSIDARAKLAGTAALIVAVTMVHRPAVLVGLFAGALFLALASRLEAWGLLARVWFAALLFTGVVVVPAIFMTPGAVVGHGPMGLAATDTGLRAAGYLLARVLTASTLSLLLVLSTRWSELLRALRAFRVPLVLVAVLAMTYRYIFVLLQTASDLFEGRRSRRIGRLTAADERRVATSTAGALLTRSMQLSEEIYLAMQARGFRGEVRILERPAMGVFDWVALAAMTLAAIAAVLVGR
jgi:cobalt/nickel transport system permease protein